MRRAIKIGLGGGLFGLFLVALFGGQSVLMAGLIAGVLAGLLGGARTEGDTMRDGIRDGVIAGGMAGVVLLIANLFRHLFLDTRLGINQPPTGETVLVGLIAAVIAVGLGAALGAAHFVRGKGSTYATWGILGA